MKAAALGSFGMMLLVSVVLRTPAVQAFPYYDDGAGNGCVQCHTGFELGPSSILHARHQSNFGITDCDTCHPNGGGSTPVMTYVSKNGGFGCAGCHGRDYGETSPNSGQPKATAYGLRQHHVNHSVPGCPGCHVAGSLGHPNPLPAILGENVAPPYYGRATNNLTDPCSSGQEDSTYDVDLVGLDNDGDTLIDYPNDPDCPMPTPTTTTLPPAQAVIGKKLLVLERQAADASKAKLVLLMKDASIAKAPSGGSGDPTANGGEVRIITSATDTKLPVPGPSVTDGEWFENGAGNLWKYRKGDGVAGDACKVVLVKDAKLIKAVCKGSNVNAIAIDTSVPNASVEAQVSTGDWKYCAKFSATTGAATVKDGSFNAGGTVAKYLSKNATTAPAECSSASGAFLEVAIPF